MYTHTQTHAAPGAGLDGDPGVLPRTGCPEPAVCVCESPSLRQQEPYSVPLLGKKGVESLLWIDVAATPARELRVGSKSARTLCVWFIGAAKCDRRPAPHCPEPAVCVCESPSLSQHELYSVPLLGN